jgi:hypothetical protein
VRPVTHRVSRHRDAEMAVRWTPTGFLEAEKSFRKIQTELHDNGLILVDEKV